VILALRGDFVPFAVNVAASEASESVRPFLPLAERVGRLFTGLAGGAPSTLNIEYEGEIADYDCRVLTLSVLKGVLAPVVTEPVSYVNAPQIAEQRGISVRETKSSDARDYVNLIVVRGDQGTHVAATLFGKHQAPRIVGIDGHQVDLPPARHMLVVHNDDSPGMIGRVGTVLGDAGINISNMDVGQSPSGEAALMVIATETAVPADVVQQMTRQVGVQSARAIDLG
jgi:D-3-phosphoglycerate dehydrogenase